jgi:hypothetical protein
MILRQLLHPQPAACDRVPPEAAGARSIKAGQAA